MQRHAMVNESALVWSSTIGLNLCWCWNNLRMLQSPRSFLLKCFTFTFRKHILSLKETRFLKDRVCDCHSAISLSGFISNRTRTQSLYTNSIKFTNGDVSSSPRHYSTGGAYVDVNSRSLMSAWHIHSYGSNEELMLSTNSRVPTIHRPWDVLVEVHAASVNPVDIKMRGNLFCL